VRFVDAPRSQVEGSMWQSTIGVLRMIEAFQA
jgi:hypothetical protein